jgi:iron complex outermembrane receptor protein
MLAKTRIDSGALWSPLALALVVALTVHGPGFAEGQDDLAEMDLEGLMATPVTSVSGVARPLRDTPAAIYVITDEDIRRGGHRTLADALRMVPGMDVAQISSSIWAISARGFNDRFSTKLLVLIDGRAIYNTLFSGVFWDVQDTVLADVDRIEVIRGPGATLWGANAVNGVINIVTKKARRTQGLYAEVGAGSEEQGFGTVRYGGKLGEDRFYRVYAMYVDRDSFEFATGADSGDEWDVSRGGFRVDFESNPDTTVTVQGDVYDGTVGSPILTPTLVAPFTERLILDAAVRGYNFMTRVEHLESPEAGWSIQAYYDQAERLRPAFFDDERETLDVEYRHHLDVGDSHALIWGIGYRYRRDETDGSFAFAFDPADGDERKYSAFLQDTIRLGQGRWSLMLGSKFEHNDFTGSEIQPGMRVAWTVDDRQTAWASLSRAVRTPSRGSNDLQLTIGIALPPAVPAPQPIRLVGNPDLDAEELHAFEMGYRCRPTDRVTFDIAGFFNEYERLISIGKATPNPLEVTFSNATTGDSHGFELTTRWDATDRARLAASYSYLDVRLQGLSESDEDTSPRHQFNVRSYLDLGEAVELNAAAYFVDELTAGDVDSYVRLDAGVSWQAGPDVELSAWGQNLLESGHTEFIDTFFVIDPIEVEPSVYGQVSIRF